MQSEIKNYFPEEVVVTDQTIDISHFSDEWKKSVVLLAEQILTEYKKKGAQRFVAVLAGASGSSKSTTAIVLEHLLNAMQSKAHAVTIGQDAYHFKQEYLLKTFDERGEPLAAHKGRYDSFDVAAMREDIESFREGNSVMFPAYSRKIHDPIPEAIPCDGESAILIFEGLWLLYDEKPWNELLPLYDFTIFMNTPADIRKHNTIIRHVRGSEHSPKDAEDFYEKSDAKNAELILAHVGVHDLDFEYKK